MTDTPLSHVADPLGRPVCHLYPPGSEASGPLVPRRQLSVRQGAVASVFSSGSFHTLVVLIAPCSICNMSEIATGVTSTLISRAADVVLKERRKLALMVRETRLHLGHLRTMTNFAEVGAITMPPVLAFHVLPEMIADIVDHSVGRALGLFDVACRAVRRWAGMLATHEAASESR